MQQQDTLTQLVIEYKLTNRESLLLDIQRLTKKLIWKACYYYGVQNFKAIDIDDIEADCRTWVLLNTIAKFDPDRGVRFSTLYVWWLKSHVRNKAQQYLRRRDVIETAPIDALLEDSDNRVAARSGGRDFIGGMNIEQILSNGFNNGVKNRIHGRMLEMFCIKGE
jgi:hypothetical protein